MQKIAILGGALLLGLTTQAHAVYRIFPAEWNQPLSVSAAAVTATNDGWDDGYEENEDDATATYHLDWVEEFPQDTPGPILVTFYVDSATGTCVGTGIEDESEAVSEVSGGFVGRSWWSSGEGFKRDNGNSPPNDSPGETFSDEISKWYGGSPVISVGLELSARTKVKAQGRNNGNYTVIAGAASAEKTGYLLEPQ